MTNTLTDKIKSASFTKKQKKIADYFLNNQEKIGNLSSFEVAQEIGVSDASVIRFCRVIGYDGFKDLKDHLYDMLVENAFAGLSLAERMAQSSERFQADVPSPDNAQRMLTQFQTLVQQNMLASFRNNAGDIDRVAGLLTSAKRRYVIGMRGCKGLALAFSRLLGFMLPNVTCLLDGECTSISALQDAGPEDAVLMFVFSRYYKIDVEYLELAQKRGAQICLVANDLAEPLRRYASVMLLTSTAGMSFFHSTTGTVMLAEYLLTLIGQRVDYKDRLEERDELTQDQRLPGSGRIYTVDR